MNDDRQRQIILQIDLLELQNLKTFQELRLGFQDLVGSIRTQLGDVKDHFTKEEQQTRKLIEDLDVSEKQRQHRAHVLDTLSFDTMHTRQEEISDAYSETFGWIFYTDHQAMSPWDNFAEWLVSGEEVYWINGKAGSGKSTVCFHHHTWNQTQGRHDLLQRGDAHCWAIAYEFYRVQR